MTYPETLLAQKIGVPRPRPQSACHKSSLGIPLRPGNTCSKPFIRVQFTRMLERLIRVLLIIRDELGQNGKEAKCAKNIIRDTQTRVWLTDCDLRGNTKKKEDDILNHS